MECNCNYIFKQMSQSATNQVLNSHCVVKGIRAFPPIDQLCCRPV